MKRNNGDLIIDGNAFYEIDRECMNKGINHDKKYATQERNLKNNEKKTKK